MFWIKLLPTTSYRSYSTYYGEFTCKRTRTIYIYTKNTQRNWMNKSDNEKWRTGLCQCDGQCGICCLACFCPFIQFGTNYQKLKDVPRSVSILDNCIPNSDAKCCLASSVYLAINTVAGSGCLLSNSLGISYLSFIACFQCFNCCLHYDMRSNIRKSMQLRADPCCDILTVCFCTPCAMAQEYSELDHFHKENGKSHILNSQNYHGVIPNHRMVF